MHNSNQNLSPGATSPTDITSDQEGTINKNSIESGTEQSLQGSSVGNQDSLNDYVDASSTPVSEGINDTMQVADDNEVTSGNKGNRRYPFSRVVAENKQQELQTKLDAANTEKTDLQQQLASSTDEQKKVNNAVDNLFTEKLNGEISGLIGLTGQELEDKVKSLYDEKLKNTIEGIIGNNLSEMKDEDKELLHKGLQSKIKSIIETDQSKNVDEIVKSMKKELRDSIISASKSNEVANLRQLVKAKENEKTDLQTKLNAAENEKTGLQTQLRTANEELKAKINQPNAKVEGLKKDLQAQNARVHQLEKENKELEAKNKTTEQPKQGNGAKYTATVGVGLAAGLIAFTALEHTVRLEMLVIIGIAVTSALVAGGITYAALPSTQVDGAEAQKVNVNNKGK